MAAIAVLHDVNLAAAFAHRVVLMREGRVLADGAPEQVLDSEAIGAVYGVSMASAEIGSRRAFAPRRRG
jgi:iron complex transport system ATP-binding protein